VCESCEDGQTPLHHVSYAQMIPLLLEAGAEIEAWDFVSSVPYRQQIEVDPSLVGQDTSLLCE
jgi:hypothetical protein